MFGGAGKGMEGNILFLQLTRQVIVSVCYFLNFMFCCIVMKFVSKAIHEQLGFRIY